MALPESAHSSFSLNGLSFELGECFMVTYVTLATSMSGGFMAIGGVTCATRNIFGWGGACQDMQSDVLRNASLNERNGNQS